MTKRFTPRPGIWITEEHDWRGKPWWTWKVAVYDWTNAEVKEEGFAHTLQELTEEIGGAVTRVLLQDAAMFHVGRQKEGL